MQGVMIMATQTSLIAQQTRIQEWAEQIRDCRSRPKGMDVETWCAQNNLTKANYYYRLRRVRKVYLEQFQETSPEFIEISNPKPQIPEAEKLSSSASTGAIPVIKLTNPQGFSAEIFSNIPAELLQFFIKVFSHAE
jgi:hypothetical protein